MTPSDLTPWLSTLAEIADNFSTKIPGTGGLVVGVVAVALRFAADLADQGINPAEHLERIHAADMALIGIEGSWAQKLHEKFGNS